MRIIAGKFRSRQLKPVKHLKIRPTSDMLRETLFNILGPRVEGARFLDLFAGTGAVGIEAVSRGAAFVAFAERHKPTARLISDNLAALEITGGVRVMAVDALSALAKLESERAAPFDFIFLDPPYANGNAYKETLRALNESSLLSESCILIAEHSKTAALPGALGRLQQFRTLKQGDAALTFYRILAGSEPKAGTEI
jgi:16S rRNA (guanine(966)-N(2))-methyltransferase RsmD